MFAAFQSWLLRRWRAMPLSEGAFPTPREALSAWFLRGQGIEIGPLNHPLLVLPAARVQYVDRMPLEDLRQHYRELDPASLTGPDIIDDGERLTKFQDDSLDFIIANHMLEHCEDPIGTLKTFFARLRPGGVLYLAIPDKRYTFDRERALTPLEHLIADHREGPERSRREHYASWIQDIHGVTNPEELRVTTDQLIEERRSIHFHVWRYEDLLELIAYTRQALGLCWEPVAAIQHADEAIFVLRKDSDAS